MSRAIADTLCACLCVCRAVCVCLCASVLRCLLCGFCTACVSILMSCSHWECPVLHVHMQAGGVCGVHALHCAALGIPCMLQQALAFGHVGSCCLSTVCVLCVRAVVMCVSCPEAGWCLLGVFLLSVSSLVSCYSCSTTSQGVPLSFQGDTVGSTAGWLFGQAISNLPAPTAAAAAACPWTQLMATRLSCLSSASDWMTCCSSVHTLAPGALQRVFPSCMYRGRRLV